MEVPYHSMATQAHESVLAKLFNDSDYSDLKLQCRGKVYDLHRNIVCSQSAFFAGACGEWKVCPHVLLVATLIANILKIQEGGSGVIDLSADDGTAVDRLVTFFYSGQYHNYQRDDDQQESHNPLLDIQVNTIADKYDVQILKDQSEASFKLWLEEVKDDAVNDDFVKVIDDVLGLEHQNNLVEAVFDLFVSKGALFLEEEGIQASLTSHPEFLLRLHINALAQNSNFTKEKDNLYDSYVK